VIDSVVDDQGRDLYEKPDASSDEEWYWYYGYPQGFCSMSQHISFSHPRKGVSSLASIRGRVRLKFPVSTKVLSFNDPAGSVGKKQIAKGFNLELKYFTVHESVATVTLRVTGDPDQAEKPPWDEDSLLGSGPFSYGSVHLRTEEGFRIRSHKMTTAITGDRRTCTYEFRTRDSEIAAVEARFDLEHHVETVEFELKNVPLPKQAAERGKK
jgi:hypothetical protein